MTKLEIFKIGMYRRVFNISWPSWFLISFFLLFSSPLSLFFFFFLNGKYSKQYRDYNSKALLGECNRSDFQWEVNRFFSYIKE